jgi:hypothetical protein
MTHDWNAWFRGYSADAEHVDPTALAARYGAAFLAASPAGSATFPNDDAFLAWLRAVREGNVAAGLLSMGVASTREVPLGPAFALVTVTWEARFRATGDRPIRFEVSYLVTTGESPKVLAFVSHEDQEDAMRRAGIPSP